MSKSKGGKQLEKTGERKSLILNGKFPCVIQWGGPEERMAEDSPQDKSKPDVGET